MEQKLRRDRCMGDNLRRLRLSGGLSQEKLCAELQRRGCDIGRTTYAKYESGELNIRVSVLIELRNIYACSYDDFFAGLEWCGNIKWKLPLSPIVHRCESGSFFIRSVRPLWSVQALLGLYFSSPVSTQRIKSLISCSVHPLERKPRMSLATSDICILSLPFLLRLVCRQFILPLRLKYRPW